MSLKLPFNFGRNSQSLTATGLILILFDSGNAEAEVSDYLTDEDINLFDKMLSFPVD